MTCANRQKSVGVWVDSTAGSEVQRLERGAGDDDLVHQDRDGAHHDHSPRRLRRTLQSWGSESWSPTVAISRSATISATSCDGTTCTWPRSESATQWAIAHTSGTGATCALNSDHVTDNGTRCSSHGTWAGYCLAFIDSAYLNAVGQAGTGLDLDCEDMYAIARPPGSSGRRFP